MGTDRPTAGIPVQSLCHLLLSPSHQDDRKMKVSWNAKLITDGMMEMHVAPVPLLYRSHAWRVERRRFILVNDDVMPLRLSSASPAYPGTLTGNTHFSYLER